MNRLMAAILVVLLIGASSFAAYQYASNQQLTDENQRLRSQLDQRAHQLRSLEDEKRQLQAELNKTRSEQARMEAKIASLEANITALQEQLQIMALLVTSASTLLTGAYRQDVNGWIFIHVEGKPFQIGYQRGYLTASEIVHALEAYRYIAQNWGYPWGFYRATAQRMWWPKMPAEFREEIIGIVEGVRARGYDVDWVDIVAANGRYDAEYYWDYLAFNSLPIPKDLGNFERTGDVLQRLRNRETGCSAFIATGNATLTHEIVMGHNTWTSYVVAIGSVYNIILDMKPERGHEILMEPQAFAIYSGRDWTINSAGLMEEETTIPGMIRYYNPEGLAYFIRVRYAMQYASTIDEFTKMMLDENNGAYSNDYLIGDAKTGEIAEFELGAHHYALARTFNGFIGSGNYPVSAGIREEDTGIYDWTDPSTSGYSRYRRWQELRTQYYGQVTVELGKQFLADHYDTYRHQLEPSLRTLCGHGETQGSPSGAVDGKVTSTSLALGMQTWAHLGHPCGTSFYAEPFLSQYPEYNWQRPYLGDLLAGQWTLFSARTTLVETAATSVLALMASQSRDYLRLVIIPARMRLWTDLVAGNRSAAALV